MTTIAAAASPDGPVVNDSAEAKRPTALLDWSLHVDCPKCGLSNDLASSLHDAEYRIARRIFTNAWDDLQDWEVTCEGCEHEFTIERVKY